MALAQEKPSPFRDEVEAEPMALGAGVPAAEIEENVIVELEKLLDALPPQDPFESEPKDAVDKRYPIDMNAPLPALDSHYAKAYRASDSMNPGRKLYALILDNHAPYRQNAIDKLQGLDHPNLVSLVAAKPTLLSRLGEKRMVLVLTEPEGQSLADIIASKPGYHERLIVDQFIDPICRAIKALRDRGITHGRVHPKHIFISNKVVLGECVSEPCGFSQETIYEPIERMLATPLGKGEGTNKTDSYALAMLAYDMLYGLDRFRQMNIGEYTRYILEQGPYNALAQHVNNDFSLMYQDFFRGLLNERADERWSTDQIANWINGKTYNLIHPSIPRECSRPFIYNKAEYFNQISLAHGISLDTDEAKRTLRQAKLDRWLDTSVHRAEVGDQVQRVIRTTGGEYASDAKQNREMVARIISVLDPQGPIRKEKIACQVDAIGLVLADYLRSNQREELNFLVEMIQNDLPAFWADLNKENRSADISNMLWRLQRVRLIMHSNSIGFGIERLVYDLNPHLPCQSPLLLRYHITAMDELLPTLDALAKTKARGTSLLDRHLAAFVASKIELSKEVTFNQLNHLPDLKQNAELMVIKILSEAQGKDPKAKHPALATWCAMRISDLINHIHNRKLRRKLRGELKSAAKSGRIERVMGVILNKEVTSDDYEGFGRALTLYQTNAEKIARLRDPKIVDKMAAQLGGRLSVSLSYLALAITCYFIASQYLEW